MKQEEKELLLKDLCARLPYGVKVQYHWKREDKCIDEDRELDFSDVETLKYNNENSQGSWCEISWKPYLRPMSSMTEEEKEDFEFIREWNGELNGIGGYYVEVDDTSKYIDYLNSHHFDYRGLIEKGLALEAPEGMYQ